MTASAGAQRSLGGSAAGTKVVANGEAAPARSFTVEFTEQEGQALLQLIDAGVRARGLELAAAAAIVNQKVQAAWGAWGERRGDGETGRRGDGA